VPRFFKRPLAHHSRTRHVGILPSSINPAATAVARAGFGAIGFASIGSRRGHRRETRRIDLGAKAAPGIDAMKAQYKRPATIPFPKENPYTPKRLRSARSSISIHAALGDVSAILRELSQPGLRLGRRPGGRRRPWHGEARPPFADHRQCRVGRDLHVGRPAGDLEEQALGPIQAAGEMNMPLEQLMERLNSIGEYKPLFAAAFPSEGMSAKTLAKAMRPMNVPWSPSVRRSIVDRRK
jgi:cytochrome c peroxidase